VSFTTSTVGLRASSRAMRPPGRYSAARAWMQPSQLRMATSRGIPNSCAASMNAPGVTYLQQHASIQESGRRLQEMRRLPICSVVQHANHELLASHNQDTAPTPKELCIA
jgi:hypothetical protein